MVEFIKWCFRSSDSTLVTLILISGIGYFILDFVKAIGNKK